MKDGENPSGPPADPQTASEEAAIAAFEGLPPEWVETFRTIVAYLAVGEARSGAHFGGPPVATMLLSRLDAARRHGMPPPRARTEDTAIAW